MNKLQKEAIAHYDRMIAWAETVPENSPPSRVTMGVALLGESWTAEYCSYCVEHQSECPKCRLHDDSVFDINRTGNTGCCDGLWIKMSTALTWNE